MKICLLIVDLQKEFLIGHVAPQKISLACEHINYAAELLRKQNHLIIHVKDVEGDKDPNSEWLDFIPEIKQHTSDTTLVKPESNAFWKTDLENILIKEQIDLVIVSGFAAENCVLFTYNGAIERGFSTVLLQNGMLSRNDDAITAANRDRNLISYPAIKAFTN